MMDRFIDKRPWLVLAAILLLGLFLRTYCLECESLWLDEGFTVWWVKDSFDASYSGPISDVQMPLYYMVLFLWTSVFGISEFSLRFPSALFGTASVFLLYLIGKRLFGTKEGLMASLILALSALNIYYSQEARPYSMLFFFGLASMYFFIRLNERKPLYFMGYVACTAFLLYTHMLGAFVVAVQWAYLILLYLMRRKPGIKPKDWLLTQAGLVLVLIPWIGIIIDQTIRFGERGYTSWIPLPTLVSLGGTLLEFSGMYRFHFSMLSVASSVLLLIVFSYLVLSQFISFKKPFLKTDRERLFLILWLALPMLLPFLISYLVKPIYWTRYITIASAGLYLLAARGVFSIKNNRIMLSVILIIVLLSSALVVDYNTVLKKEQWRESISFVNENSKDSDLVLFSPWFLSVGPFNYYYNAAGFLESFPAYPETAITEENSKKTHVAVRGYDRIWLITSRSTSGLVFLEERLLLEYNKTLAKEFNGVNVTFFEKTNPI